MASNWVPSIHQWAHSIVPVSNFPEAPTRHAQYLVGFNCFEADYITALGETFSLKENDHFLIKGCGAYDLQTMTQWVRCKPVVYKYDDRRLGLCRSPSKPNCLVLDDIYCVSEDIKITEALSSVNAKPSYAKDLFELITKNKKTLKVICAGLETQDVRKT